MLLLDNTLQVESQKRFAVDFATVSTPETLVQLALTAAQSAGEGMRDVLAQGVPARAFRGAMLLTLLSYCYARGVYGSRDIELFSQQDRQALYICSNNVPDWNVIRRFRRAHARTVQRCLGEMVANITTGRTGDSIETNRTYALASFNRWSDPRNEAFLEAGRRVANAVKVDSMAMDE